MKRSEHQPPAAVELLWGTSERADRDGRERLSAARIVEAAVELADADGLEAVSMSRVAERLGSATMALYRHVRNKDELLVLMVNAALAPPPRGAGAESGGWRPRLEQWCFDILGVLRQHPWVLRVPITGPPATPSQLAWLDRGLSALASTDLSEAEKAATILVLNGHVFWGARLFAEIDDAGGASAASADVLKTAVDTERFPALRQAVDAGIFADNSNDADFRYGLDRILDGVERLLEERAG
jgi:AcrR family transcriptional regulator